MTMHPHVERALAACAPASEIGAALLERYAAAVDVYGWPPRERSLLYELCRLVEQTEFRTVSLEQLDAAAEADTSTAAARQRRKQLKRRLVALLRGTGELPPAREIRVSRATSKLLAELQPQAQAMLGRWHALRRERLGAWELHHEIRRLAVLEQVIAERPTAAEEYHLDRFLGRLVRRIVACNCHPISRRHDPPECTSCGATAASHGTKPSPAVGKQRRYLREARRYLSFRRDYQITRGA